MIIQTVAARYNPQLTVVSIAAIIAAGVIYIRRSVTGGGTVPSLHIRWNRRVIVDTLFVAFLAAVAGLFVLWVFPPPEQIIRDSGAVDIIGHATGLVYGSVIALIALRLEPSAPASQVSPSRNQIENRG